jgi:hypothetical protein
VGRIGNKHAGNDDITTITGVVAPYLRPGGMEKAASRCFAMPPLC